MLELRAKSPRPTATAFSDTSLNRFHFPILIACVRATDRPQGNLSAYSSTASVSTPAFRPDTTPAHGGLQT